VKDGINWYAYCLDNPITRIDPTGLYTQEQFDEGQRIADKMARETNNMSADQQMQYILDWSVNSYLDEARRSDITWYNSFENRANVLMALAERIGTGMDYGNLEKRFPGIFGVINASLGTKVGPGLFGGFNNEQTINPILTMRVALNINSHEGLETLNAQDLYGIMFRDLQRENVNNRFGEFGKHMSRFAFLAQEEGLPEQFLGFCLVIAGKMQSSIPIAGFNLNGRITELQNAIPEKASGFGTTMAVAEVRDAYGRSITLISTNEANAYLRRGVDLKPGEVMVPSTGQHAEMNILNYALENNLTIIQMGATRPVCVDCQSISTPYGVVYTTPLKK
jgi:hypothetical protein